jgi:cyclopropane fatty-acyl-phospholipid synthase-like methyltransferase
MSKPYAEACDRNRDPILAVIKTLLVEPQTVLEIGSGTGQHAVYFAGHMPHLIWQTSDVVENLAGIRLWLEDAGLPNTPLPLLLDVSGTEWAALRFDSVFSANCVHIMGWDQVKDFIRGAGSSLPAGGQLIMYGPFNYGNEYTSLSNRRFDAWLRERDPASGIRNFEDVDQLAKNSDLFLTGDYEMPANNRVLCWQKE